MKGKCLCGAIEFELSGEMPGLYQCHCSLCRRVSGSSANAAFRIGADRLSWTSGSELISTYATGSGFRSHFCSVCGSPVPNLTGDGQAWWIPAGLLDDGGELELAAHLYVASKAGWDVIADAGVRFDEMPRADDLDRLLRRGKAVT